MPGSKPRKLEDKRTPEFYREIGKKGGSATAAKYGSEFYSQIGQKGGSALRDQHGSKHFSEIGRKGGRRGQA